ncbi:MAG: hypothetical protein ACON4U_00565 [Myxococcota bacterium]
MYNDIPFADFFISERLRQRLIGQPNSSARLALASGASCENDVEKLSLLILLTADEEQKVADQARKNLNAMGPEMVAKILPTDSHAQIVGFLTQFFTGSEKLDERLIQCIYLPSEAAFLISNRASARVCEEIARARQLLLLNPQLIFRLQNNPSCPPSAYSRAESFLRMQKAMPTEEMVMFEETSSAGQLSASDVDLEAEVMAALSGGQSASLSKASSFEQFSIGETNNGPSSSNAFSDINLGSGDASSKSAFSFDLNAFGDETEEEEEKAHQSWEKKIKDMSVGHKIKLAFKGNKECRSILIRDTNKTVSVAVVKSGRLTDGEVASFAGNRNLSDDVIREIARNNEFVRKYPVKVALINNPKTPVATALGFLSSLHKKDLQALMLNRNVPSVVSGAARKRFKDKYRKS